MNIAEKLQTIAENEQKVYEAGIQQGKQAYRSEFWNSFKTGVPAWEWNYLFAGRGWDDFTFNPNYNIVVPSYRVDGLFNYNSVTDLAAILKRNGVTFDASKCPFVNCWWQNAKITHSPVLDLSSATTLVNLFYACLSLTKIDKLIFSNKTGTSTISNPFSGCSALVELEMEGEVACNFDIKSSTLLNTASIISVMEHLSSTTTGKTATFSQTAVNNMTFPHTSTQSGVTYNSWDELIATKQNWTIALSA